MTTPIITVKDLGKEYRLGSDTGGYGRLTESLQSAMARGLRRKQDPSSLTEHVWALRDVTFEVQAGEVLGIIGRNGAGKSTLLKILARITPPTEGEARLHGRVGVLLEVGTGFHPELSGRENVFLSGAILGMTRVEIRRKFDEIVSFSEVERFIDTPVKRYSSGMQVRLAFAVAAHLEPEILIVDEVLAVGDAKFQKRCLGKMNEVSREGRTVLFVSHNMAAVENLCQTGLVLENGRPVFMGSAHDAVGRYLSTLGSSRSLAERVDRRGSGRLRVVDMECRDLAGNVIDIVRSGQSFDLYLHYETEAEIPPGVISSVLIKTQMDVPVFLHHNRLTAQPFDALPSKGSFVLRVERLPLVPGEYHVDIDVRDAAEEFDAVPEAMELTVIEGDFFGSGEVPLSGHGFALVDGSWRVESR